MTLGIKMFYDTNKTFVCLQIQYTVYCMTPESGETIEMMR